MTTEADRCNDFGMLTAIRRGLPPNYDAFRQKGGTARSPPHPGWNGLLADIVTSDPQPETMVSA
ncbi:MAG: hypothetical protein M3Y77_21835 [Actinomycetota bacterium]|nr:hypothetical protein [Actinomycetota bacterium]